MSCSSEDDQGETSNSGLTNLEISVTNKTTTSVVLSTTSDGGSNVTTEINYALSGTGNYQQTSSNTIEGLEKGTKYDMFFKRFSNGQEFVSPTISVTTLGFNLEAGTTFLATDVEVNHLYNLIASNGAEFGEFAQPINGYIIIENDSVPLLNVTTTPLTIDFEVGKNVRSILPTTTDENYVYDYPFEIGLFTKEAYTRITTNSQTNTRGRVRSAFSLNNHVPFISSSVLTDINTCINLNGTIGLLQPRGNFWLRDQGVSSISDFNKMDFYNVKVTNINDPSITRTFVNEEGVTVVDINLNCAAEGVATAREAVSGRQGFHDANILSVRLNRNFFIDGDYTLQFIAEDDNVSYFSNEFLVTLE